MKAISGSTRHIHLDFHTPPEVKVGEDFKIDEFFDTLEAAKVNSLAVFAHCHHGYSYFNTTTGVRHPGLDFDLFGDIAREAGKRNIILFAYFSLNVNEVQSALHPDWLAVDRDGQAVNSQILLDGTELYWSWHCPNRGRLLEDFFYPHVCEVLEKYPVDGVFVDMAGYLPGSCYCPECLKKMREAGLDPDNAKDHKSFNSKTIQALSVKLRQKMDEIKPGLRLQMGSYSAYGEPPKADGVISEFYLESLAYQTGWEYFPFAARYFRNFNLPCMGMTGRFLKNWGDFGTVTSPAQMKYQLGCHLLAGMESAVGDHLPCTGKLNPAVYNIIGEGYNFIEKRQKYCVGMEPCREIGIIMPTGIDSNAATLSRNNPGKVLEASVKAAAKLATELHYQYDIYTHNQDYSASSAIIVSDSFFSLSDAGKMVDFAAQGGLVIVNPAAVAPVDQVCREYWQKIIGVSKFAYAEDDGEFYHLNNPVPEIPDMNHYLHCGAVNIEFDSMVKVLATKKRSPFVRSREHHYGHFHGPALCDGGAGIGFKPHGAGGFIILGMELCYNYWTTDYWVHRELMRTLLDDYFPANRRLIHTNAPSVVEVSLGLKAGKTILQLLPFVADRRSRESFESVNSQIMLHDIWVQLPNLEIRRAYDPVSEYECEIQDGKILLPPFCEHLPVILE